MGAWLDQTVNFLGLIHGQRFTDHLYEVVCRAEPPIWLLDNAYKDVRVVVFNLVTFAKPLSSSFDRAHCVV